MEKFWFFNSAPGDPRVYQAQDFANYFGLVLTSGILAVNNQMGLQVEADGTDMRVYVEPGKAIIKGNAYENTANEYLTVDLPEATENRIDRIVLRHDLTNANRHIKVFVKRGTASAPPDLQRDNFVYEISLAQVLLEANTSTIDPLNITDERMDENLAGIVHSMITVPTSQFQEQWDEWFDTNVPAYEQEWRNFMDTLTGQSPVMSVNGNTPDANGNVEVAVDTSAIEAEIDTLSNEIGILSGLNTTNKTNLVASINELFTNVSNGKTQIATAITDKGVAASGGDTFPQLATKIGQISSEVTGETVRTLTAGVALTKGERVEYGRNDKLPNPASLPTSTVSDLAFESSNTYLAVAQSGSTRPYLHLYKRSGDTFTKLANPEVMPSSPTESCAFSPHGDYLAVATRSQYTGINIYKRSGDTFTKLANPSTMPPDESYGCAFSPDGTHLVVGHKTSPFITIYKRSGDTFTKLANPSTLPSNTVTSVTFSSDGVYLAVRILNFDSTASIVYVYKRSGDAFTVVWSATLTMTQPAQSRHISFSPNGDYLAVPGTVSPFIHIYKRSGDTFTKLANPSILPAEAVGSAAFSPDGDYLYAGINIYRRNGDTFTRQPDPTEMPSNIGTGLAFTPNGQYWAISNSSTSPYFFLYKTIGNVTKNEGVVTAGKSLGYAKTSASSGQSVDVAVLFE